MKKRTMKMGILSFCLLASCALNAQNIEQLQRDADAGNAQAQYELACFYTEKHDRTDYELALKYLRKSAERGNKQAEQKMKDLTSRGYDVWGEYELTPLYDVGICDSSTEEILQKHAFENNVGASLVLAHSYYNKKEYQYAVKYYKHILKNIDPDNSNLGYLGEEKMEAYDILIDAATRLAFCYEHGLGVEKNLTLSLTYYQMLGGYIEDPDICIKIKNVLDEYKNQGLAEMVQECGGQIYDCFVPDPRVMRAWDKVAILYIKLKDYDHASEALCENLGLQGNGARTFWTGELFYKGLGRTQNYEEAFRCFNYLATEAKAAWDTDFNMTYPELYADACYRLYECYAYGRGIKVDDSKARYYFREALKYGSSSALYDDQRKYEILNN